MVETAIQEKRKVYHHWEDVPDNLKTKSSWKKEHRKIVNDEPDATINYFAYKWRNYNLYSIDKTVPVRRYKKVVREIEPSIANIAKSLYIVNKSAKKSRDTKNLNYYDEKYTVVRRSKTRQYKLYALKDQVMKKLIQNGQAKLVGFHTQRNREYGEDKNYLKLYSVDRYVFHVPSTFAECKHLKYLGELGIVSATNNAKGEIKLTEAINLLKKFIGDPVTS